MQRNTFKKIERLTSKKLIDRLFLEGSRTSSFPLRAVWLCIDEEENDVAQILISVPKKYFKSAVKRNKIKRLIREAYRLNKHGFYEKLNSHNIKMVFAVVYNDNIIAEYKEIEEKLIITLDRIREEAIAQKK